MQGHKTIARNGAYLLLNELISKGLLFFLFIYAARVLGTAGIGEYSFIVAFVGIGALFIDLGTNYLLIRDVATNKSLTEKYFNNLFIFKFWVSIAVIVFVLVSMMLISKNLIVIASSVIFAIAISLNSLGDLIKAVFRAYENFRLDMLINSVTSLIIALLGGFALFFNFGLVGLMAGYLAGYFCNFILGYGFLINYFKPKLKFDFAFLKNLLGKGFYFAVLSAIVPIYLNLDIVMLSFLAPPTLNNVYVNASLETVVGWYGVAFKLFAIIGLMAFLFLGAALPSLAAALSRTKEDFILLARKTFIYLFSFSLPASIAFIFLAEKLIPFFYGSGFQPSIIALKLLGLELGIIFLIAFVANMINILGKEKPHAYVAVAGTLLNIALNFILIPQYSFIGAVIGTIIASSIVFLIFAPWLNGFMNAVFFNLKNLKLVLANIVFLLLIFALKDIPLIPELAILSIVYIMLIQLLGVIDFRELI